MTKAHSHHAFVEPNSMKGTGSHHFQVHINDFDALLLPAEIADSLLQRLI